VPGDSESRIWRRSPDTLYTLDAVAQTLCSKGEYDRALPLHEECLAKRKAVFGCDHPATFDSIDNLGKVFLGNGQYSRAWPLFEQCLTWRRQNLGEDHPLTIQSLSILAGLFNKMADYDRALPLLEECLEKQKVCFGADSSDAKSTQMMRDECARKLKKKSGKCLFM
jgi:tetratricopeptide (TPR) repeat protein